MIIRVKDLWMKKVSVERVLGAKLPATQAQLLSEAGERLWDALTDYQVSRKRIWQRLGLDKMKEESLERQALIEQFNDEAAQLAEEEISLPEAVPVEALDGLSVSVVDLNAMKQLGVIRA